MGNENPDIRESASFAFIPKVLCPDVQSGPILCAAATLMEALSTEGLQCRLNTHVRANLNKELSKDVPDAIVSQGWHCSLGTTEGMAHIEWVSTEAV